MTVRRIERWILRAPAAAPLRTAFGAMHERTSLLVRVSASDGAHGWGEVYCNFPPGGARHRARLVDSIFSVLLEDAPSDDPEALCAELEARTRRMALQCGEPGPFAQVLAGIDQALWDLRARRAGVPLWRLLDREGRGTPHVRVYASGLGPDGVAEAGARLRGAGHNAFKLKVGFGDERDTQNFRSLREAVGPEATIMADANQAWEPETAAAHIARLAPFAPAWVEEPLAADVEARHWKQLADDCGVPLAAGENILGLPAFEAALHGGFLRFVQPDVGKWGGISRGRQVAAQAMGAGAEFCPHWLSGGVGLAASLHLRAALGEGGWAEIDANDNPLREELLPLRVAGGRITLPELPGLGVEPDAAWLAAHEEKA